MIREIRIGTRGSTLARRQTDFIVELLCAAWTGICTSIEVIHSQGDILHDTPLPVIGGIGVFTQEIEKALRKEQIDIAVHSLKDLPVQSTFGISLGAIPQRSNPADVLVSRSGARLMELPLGACVGTSSLRRAAQLRRIRPDLQISDIRGNVDTRLKKVFDPNGEFDAIILAYAGLERLGCLDVITEILPLELMLPAPGQGALAVQCRDTIEWKNLLAPLNHQETLLAVTAERAFLQGLGGGCVLPVATYAQVSPHIIDLHGRIISPDGSRQIDLVRTASLGDSGDALVAQNLGFELAQEAIFQGAHDLLNGACHA